MTELADASYRILFESNPHPMWVYDLKTLRFLAVNQAAVRHYGYSRRKFLSMTIRDIRPAQDIPRLLKAIESSKPGIQPSGIWRHRRKNGTLIDVEVIGQILMFQGRRAKLILAQDVTERERAVQSIHQSEERFRNLVETTNDVIWETDGRGVYRYVSPQIRSLLGYRAREVLGKTPVDLVAPEEKRRMRAQVSRIISTRKPFRSLQTVFQHKYGRRVIIETSGVPIFGEKGKFSGYRGIDRDVTDRRLAEEQLLMLGKAAESSGEAIFLTDPEGIFTFVNPEFTRLYGYAAEEVLGKVTPQILKSGTMKQKEYENFWRAIGHREVVRKEFVNRRKDGSLLDIEAAVNPIVDEGGITRGYLAIQRDITARRRQEEALLAAEEKFRGLVEQSLVGIYIIQNDRFQYINPTFADIFGYSQEEILALDSTLKVVDPADRSRVEHNIRKRIEGRVKSIRYQFRGIRKGGDRIDVEVNGTVTTFQGKPAVIGTLLDVTQRKRAEKELQRVNRALETITECNQAMVRASGEKELLHEVCDIVVRRGGYRLAWIGYAEAAGGRRIMPVARAGYDRGYVKSLALSAEDSDRGRGPAGRALREGTPFAVQDVETDPSFRLWRSEAVKRRYGSVVGLPLMFKGRTLGVMVIYAEERHAFDATEVHLLNELANDLSYGIVTMRTRSEHNRAMEKIREQAELLDIATDAIIVRAVDGTVTYWNKGAERLYKWSSTEAMGKDLESLLKRDHEPGGGIALQTVLADGAWAGEMEQTTKDDVPVVVESRWTLVRNEAGKPESILIVNTDITAKKRLEAQFMRAQRMEGIGTLAGGIAHDLNNVLAPILMAIEILKTKYPDEQSAQILATIEGSAVRGADMVKQVLTFARGIEGERIVLNPRHLVREMEKIGRETFPKSIHIVGDIPKESWMIRGDATQLHQVLLNLCVNARDAMPTGGTLRIGLEKAVLDAQYARMHPEAKPGQYVVLVVGDSGTGIPAENINKIFEPFFTTKAVGHGTGLGLSTVHTIVRSHGGFTNVYSEVEKGTTFRVYLPAVLSADAGERASLQRSLPAGHGELILVVDDELSIRQITAETLEAYGYRVISAADGTEALAIYARQGGEISLVLTDVLMPFMDGPATIRALRRINPKIKIIAASGLTAHEKNAELPSSQVKAFLTKPYTAQKLLETIRAVLETDRSG